MKKIICGKEYDTEKSKVVKKITSGNFGDPSGFETTLYITEDGKYFLYTSGGADSEYSGEGIKRMSEASAKRWLEDNK